MSVDSDSMDMQLTVGDVATPHEKLPTCSTELPLADLAQLLLSSGQMAATVVNQDGTPMGLVSEDDVMQGYWQGAPWDCTVGEWIRGGGGTSIGAGPPGRDSFAAASMLPEQPLRDAVQRLKEMPTPGPRRPAAAVGRPSLTHFLVPGTGGFGGGILSALDLARVVADHGCSPGLAEALGAETAATVAQIMEPLGEVPSFAPGGTMQQLLLKLLASPARTVLVTDGTGVHGLVTACDALWAFHEQVSHGEDAWKRLAMRPGRVSLQQRAIPLDASLQHAASAMMAPASSGGLLRNLLAVLPGGMEVAGVVAPPHLARKREAEAPPPVLPLRAEESHQQQHFGKEQPEIPEPATPPTPPSQSTVTQKSGKKRMTSGGVPATVAGIVAQRETAYCSLTDTLADASEALVDSARTAAVVMDARGIRGVLTENDLLRAYVDGAPWECSVDLWLRGGEARMPGFMVPALTISTTTTLAQAAACMASMAEENSGFACHHLLVRDKGDSVGTAASEADHPGHFRLLSALDIAKGMLDAAEAEAMAGAWNTEAGRVAAMTVKQAMKPRSDVACCAWDDSLNAAFREMYEFQQNCALVVDKRQVKLEGEPEVQLGGTIYGVITAADAIRAFAERQTGEDTSLTAWLRDLPADRKPFKQRTIAANATLAEAASAMSNSGVHHLLVVLWAGSSEVAGILSALDIVRALGSTYMWGV